MEQFSHFLTTTFGIVLVGAIAYEIKRRRRKLREVYDVLDVDDKQVVAELDLMVESGVLEPFQR